VRGGLAGGRRPADRLRAGGDRDGAAGGRPAHERDRLQGAAPGLRPKRGRGEEGFAGGFEGLLFGTLLFVFGTLLVGYAWGVVDTKAATDLAARQAARTYVQAADSAAAESSATQAAAAALQGYGRDPARAQVSISGSGFARCSRVEISVRYPAPLVELPVLGRLGEGEMVSSSRSELVDPYRTGLPGTAECP
jgi:hypothetical protein